MALRGHAPSIRSTLICVSLFMLGAAPFGAWCLLHARTGPGHRYAVATRSFERGSVRVNRDLLCALCRAARHWI